MIALFQRKLFKNWLMIFGWGVGLGLLGYYLVDIYGSVFKENVDLQSYMEVFPEEFLAFFGDADSLLTTEGFLGLEFFSYIPVILGIMAVSAASRLIAKQEEEGSLELIMAQPVSRSAVFWGKLLALIVSIILILLMTWTGLTLGANQTPSLDLAPLALLRPFISLFAVLSVFMSLALLLSMILASRGTAGLGAGFILIASYFITSLTRIDEKLESINRFSPLKYYQGSSAMTNLDLQYILILFGASIVLIALAWFVFVRRDLRFGGAGGLRLVFSPKEEK